MTLNQQYQKKVSTLKDERYKYAPPIVPNIDAAINGLLPFNVTHQGLTGCVCDGMSVKMNKDLYTDQ